MDDSSRRDRIALSTALEGLRIIAEGTAPAVSDLHGTQQFARALLDRINNLPVADTVARVTPAGAPSAFSSRVAPDSGRNRGGPFSAWEKYRPDRLTDDELAEYVRQSKGVIVP